MSQQTFSNLEPLSSVRAKLNSNADDALSKGTTTSQTISGEVEFLGETITFDKVVANDVETAGATIQVSQRVAMKAFGNELAVISPVEEDNNLLVHVPFNTQDATDELHVPRLGAMESLTFQPVDTDTFIGNQIIVPTVVAGGTGAITSVLKYKFVNAGVPVRQKTTATNSTGDTFDIYGTSADPYLYFTSEAGETVINYDSPVPVTPGVLFDSIIESVDGSPLNMLGVEVTSPPVGTTPFSPWASIEFQDFVSTPLNVDDVEDAASEDYVDSAIPTPLTDAQIKTQYENNADTNAFTDSEKTVVGNQSGTNTGDQDLSGLALKSNVLELDNTDSFTPDADYEPATKKYVDDNAGGGVPDAHAASHTDGSDDIQNATASQKGLATATQITKLDGIEAGAEAPQDISGLQVKPSEGAFIDGDKTKLDGIEVGATTDQTGAEIKVAYEGESDTNTFTDSEKTNLGNQSGTNTGDQDLSGLALKSNVLELDNTDSFTPDADYEPATKKYVDDNAGGDVDSVNGETGVVVLDTGDISEVTDKNYVTDAESTVLGNTSGTNTGDQDLSGLALKSNVLELDNTDAFTPDADYEPATKKYVDDTEIGYILATWGANLQTVGRHPAINSPANSGQITSLGIFASMPVPAAGTLDTLTYYSNTGDNTTTLQIIKNGVVAYTFNCVAPYGVETGIGLSVDIPDNIAVRYSAGTAPSEGLYTAYVR